MEAGEITTAVKDFLGSMTKMQSYLDVSIQEFRNSMSPDQLNAPDRKASNERELKYLAGYKEMSKTIMKLSDILVDLSTRLAKVEKQVSSGAGGGSSPDGSNGSSR